MSLVLLLFVSSSAEGQPAQSSAAAVDLQSAKVWGEKKSVLKKLLNSLLKHSHIEKKISEQSIKGEMNF